ncbi:hypothetical protein [Qipengyuania pacifica]|uniref:hypothetical protein n=1 Tax=Qipengyuania pacifica TaxID=2860199 RepID=UPI000C3E7CE7|nr:hypothetical protein [Qipengyuania pacifica]MBG75510.1 hypothetical protein [Erythrobacteraceae bacterium]MBY8334029.1 hypothetical protein [Qipengyuania pacifica]MEC7953083.1 hypothetical protein [Pseudomonadota bacterium]
MIFTRLARKNNAASTLALAVSIAAGGMVAASAFEAPAFAQKEKKSQPKYSKAFIEAYKPLETMASAEPVDYASIKAAVPGLVAAAENNDDRFAAGSFIYATAVKAEDQPTALQGMEMMLQSGNVPAENLGQYNFVAGQLAYAANDYAKARPYFEAAAEAGYTERDPLIFVAESYFAEDQAQQGLNYLSQIIESKVAAGEPVDEAWLKRGLAQAYNNNLKEEANKYSTWYVSQYPSSESWGDAVAIQLNTGGYQQPETLDLLRLGQRAGALRDGNVYREYVDAADYRRLPAEVVAVIDEGYAKGSLDKTDPYITDTREQAASRAEADRADADKLIADANKSGATLSTVMAAGDTMLGLKRPADAEAMYTKALSMPSADKGMVSTRLGIAQFDQGKFAEAETTFKSVNGTRKPIADLWAAYASQKASGGA